MPCPPGIAEVLVQMIAHGLLRIRSQGWSGQADSCAAEADHLHNLPDLLLNYSREKLDYYWNVERPAFADGLTGAERSGWEPHWDRLLALTEIPCEPTSAR